MENSFFEYRDKTGVDSDSDSEIIDGSITENIPYSAKKKNHTVFVAESNESSSDEESMKENEYITSKRVTKSVVVQSGAGDSHLITSSDDDGSRRGSIRRPSESQNNMVVTSSEEDEEELSPELVPKRRPPLLPKAINQNESPLIHRTKKRMLFVDSDTDNSVVIEQNKNRKHHCRKETPVKIVNKQSIVDESMENVNESCEDDDKSGGDDDISGDDDKSDGDDEISDNDDKSDSDDDKSGDDDKSSGDDEISDDDDDKSDSDDSKSDDDDDKFEKNTKISSKCKKMVINSDDSDIDDKIPSKKVENSNNQKVTHDNGDDHDSQSDDDYNCDDLDDEDGPDEDLMVMSRATRMSIMGVMPKDNDSDESDYLESESSSRKTGASSARSVEGLPEVSLRTSPRKSSISDDDLPDVSTCNSLKKPEESDDDLPEVTIHQTPGKPKSHNNSVKKAIKHEEKYESDNELPEVTIHSNNSSVISCSPFPSPNHSKLNQSSEDDNLNDLTRQTKSYNTKAENITGFMDLTQNTKPNDIRNSKTIDLSNTDYITKNKMLDMSVSVLTKKKPVFDDDVTIIDSKPEIIALSSDDEEKPKPEKKSAKPSNSTSEFQHEGPKFLGSDIKQYLAPASGPAQVVYVKKNVRENELNKLMRLKQDLNGVKTLLEEMDLESLPDGGSMLIARLTSLEADVRRQGDRVANMVVEPDEPTAADIAKDGFDKGLSWEDIQKASNAVQPRMFGKQAMATHLAERNLILERLRDLHASLGSRPADTAMAAAPRLLKSTLMPYQRHALAWLQWRETQRPCAGILADDMGLGKTITMISLVASDKEHNIDHDDDEGEGTGKLARGGTLVVCPASLLQQWAAEVGKHCGAHAFSVCLHHGAARASHPHRLATYDIVATTYNILQRDNEKNGVLMRVQWRRVILDEAHIVRNHKSATSVAVCNLKGRRRWCLTGTPVQNKDLDLFALLKFLRCSPFDDIQMWKKWIDNKSQGGQERLSTLMRCILLRRTKAALQAQGQLASLPTKTAHLTLVTLTKDEMNVYQKVLVLSKTLFAQFLHQRAEKNSGAAPFTAPGKDSEYAKMHKKMIALQGVKPVKSHEILVLLLRLRQVCCHCGLIAAMLDETTAAAPAEPASSDLLRELDKLSLEDKDRRKSQNPDQDDDEDILGEETAKADEAIRAVLSPNNPVFQLKKPSSKITAVMECLNKNVFKNKGDKAVVVSQWTSVLRLVEQELNNQKIRSVTLSGNVPVTARAQLISQLNDPKSEVKVMLLSLCAGGVGINLCGASHLLLLDPHWNPQLEEQAQDRVYRIGQDKNVHIYRFMCADTVEQSIRKLQEAKLELAENVLTGARNTAASTLSIEDLKMLFNMGN